MNLPGKVLIVGGSAGIGAALATVLADQAVVWSRRSGIDVTDADQVAAATRLFLDRHGAPWGLVHTVGDFLEQPLLQTSRQEFDAQLRSNLLTVFDVVQSLVPTMAAAGRGRVVLFAAAGVERGRAMLRAPVYFAAKAALVQLARSLAAEVAPRGVTVNVVSPGLIAHDSSHRESQQRLLPRVPVGRFGSTAEVVDLVLWLLRAESAYLTGENLTIDGGLQL